MSLTEEIDGGLTPAEQALVATARDFARTEVAPHAAAWEEAGAIDAAVFRRACALGLGTVELPRALGGAGASFRAKVRVAEELARADLPFAFCLINHHNAMHRIVEGAQPQVRDALLPPMLRGELVGCTAMTEPGAGSDFSALATRAVDTGSAWSLTGCKDWVSNAQVAGVVVLFARVGDTPGARGIASFIVRTDDPGIRRGARHAVPGARAMGLGALQLDDCRVPPERLLHGPGEAFRRAMAGVNRARVHVAAMDAGMIAAALEAASTHGRSRTAFGQPLLAHQGLAWSLAGVATGLEALRLLAYRAATRIDAGLDATLEAAMAKKYAGEHTLAALAACIQAMGARGLDPDLPLSRHLGCAKATCFADGTVEMMNERIARLLFAPAAG